MQKLFLFGSLAAALSFSSCDGGGKSTKQDDMSNMNHDTAQTTTASEADIKTVTPTFTNLDSKLSAEIKSLVSHYLHIKNALANDNAVEAASGAKAMSAVMANLDKSLFTAEQKKIYDANEDDLKEHAEHISKSKVDHQREHFVMMSDDLYALVKAYGAGQTLYHDHCPMYNDNKGAMWLSEVKDIKNPYMGSSMPKCGTVKEKIQ